MPKGSKATESDIAMWRNQQTAKRAMAQELIDQVNQYEERMFDPNDQLTERDIHAIKALKPRLITVLERLSAIHLELILAIITEEEEQEELANERCTDQIEQAMAKVDLIIERETKTQQPEVANIPIQNGPDNTLVEILKTLAQNNNGHGQQNQTVKLPQLTIEPFDGNPLKWQQFHDNFRTSVHNQPNISNVNKLNYLKNFLSGAALRLIYGIACTDDNYAIAWDILSDKYGDKNLLISVHIMELLNIKPVVNTHASLEETYDHVQHHLRILEELFNIGNGGKRIVGEYLLSKLPQDMKQKVRNYVEGQEHLLLDGILEWMDKEVKQRSASEFQNATQTEPVNVNSYPMKQQETKIQNGNKNQYEVNATTNGNRKGPSCFYCNGSHYSSSCRNIKDLKSRQDFCRQRDICFKCLKGGHRSQSCRENRRCYYCKEFDHHQSLCPIQNKSQYGWNANNKGNENSSPWKSYNKENGNSTFWKGKNQFNGQIKHAGQFNVSAQRDKAVVAKEPKSNGMLDDSMGDIKDARQMILPAIHTKSNPVRTSTTKLMVGYVGVINPGTNQRKKCHILLDSGSTRTYIKENLVTQLKLVPKGYEKLKISAFGQRVATKVNQPFVEMELNTMDGKNLKIEANVTEHLTNDMKKVRIDKKQFPILETVLLADASDGDVDEMKIQIIIGNDYYNEIVLNKRRRLDDGLYLIETRFGHMVSGRIKDATPSNEVSANFINGMIEKDKDAEPSLEKFHALDVIGVYDSGQTTDDDMAQKQFNETIQFNEKEKRYEIQWPWKDETSEIADNFNLAYYRLKSIVRRLKKYPEMMDKYNKVFMEYLEKGIIERVTPQMDQEMNKVYYMPHHCVIRPDKPTTKMRPVFDGSSSQAKDVYSLNELLHRGPVGLEDLVGMLLRFRQNKIVLISDIEKAFLQVGLQTNQRDVTRLLWLKDPYKDDFSSENLEFYRFTRVCFGVISSPFLLLATIRHHLKQIDIDSPEAKDIGNNIYVDNVIITKNTVDEAMDFYHKAKDKFSKASMNLREWCSNSKEFMAQIPEKDRAEGDVVKVLGLVWDIIKDEISIPDPKLNQHKVTTLRQLVSAVSSIYDPMGYFHAFTSYGKILWQNASKAKLKWDDPLPDEILIKWNKFYPRLDGISLIKIPRMIGIWDTNNVDAELHCFTDASMSGYAAVCYIRIPGEENKVSLLQAKHRLAPLKPITLPRLELMGVLIGTRLAKFIVSQFQQRFSRIVLWTDSECVLAWLKSSKVLEVFVRNRVKEIKENEGFEFRHVGTKDNPADLPTKPENNLVTNENKLWWKGPDWLSQSEQEWPKIKADTPDTIELVSLAHTETNKTEIKSNNTQTNECQAPFNMDIKRFSSLLKLIRTTAWVAKALTKGKKLANEKDKKKLVIKTRNYPYPNLITPEEYKSAITRWEAHLQEKYFGNIKEMINKGKSNNFIKNLGLYLDKSGFIRSSGRLKNADFPFDTKYPKLLPHDSNFVKLFIMRCHELCAHAGVSQTLSTLRQSYWIVRGRQTVKHILRKCYICNVQEGGCYQSPLPPPFPNFAVERSMPFEFTGVDYAGPITTSDIPKVWICLFTCRTTRAIHLELVSHLTGDTFFNALKRFVSRRGKPTRIISDNAKQFKWTDRTINGCWKKMTQDENDTQSYIAEKGIQWSYIPTMAPWMGGFYERLIGSVKRALKKIMGNKLMSYLELQTLIVEIEAMMNSRPLMYVSEDIDDICLTPADLLFINIKTGLPNIGKEIDPDYVPKIESQNKAVAKWRQNQRILNEYWNVWRHEYLLGLREKYWYKAIRGSSSKLPSTGTIVLIKENAPRGCWSRGIITGLNYGKDGICRTVKMKLPNQKTVVKAVRNLIPLEVPNQVTEDGQTLEDNSEDTSRGGVSQVCEE